MSKLQHKELVAMLEQQMEKEQTDNSQDVIYPKHIKLNFSHIERIKERGLSSKIRKRNSFHSKVTSTWKKKSARDDDEVEMSDSLHHAEEELDS